MRHMGMIATSGSYRRHWMAWRWWKYPSTKHWQSAQRIPVLDLCKMFGWSNPKMAMVYYNPTASDIAKRLQR